MKTMKLPALPDMAPLPRMPRAKRAISIGEETFAAHLTTAGIGYQREFKFDASRDWRFDFVICKNLAVEIEGAVWSGGRHTRGAGFVDDCEKYNRACSLGWYVLRFTTDMVLSGKAIAFVRGMAANLKGVQDGRQ